MSAIHNPSFGRRDGPIRLREARLLTGRHQFGSSRPAPEHQFMHVKWPKPSGIEFSVVCFEEQI